MPRSIASHAFFLATALTVVACTVTNTATPGTGSGGGGGGGGGSTTCSTTDGKSSCMGHTEPCNAAEYCSINICNSGCLTTANCPSGQFCDMAAATTDMAINKPIGICHPCPTSGGTDAGSSMTSSCDDVHGVYSMTADSSSSMGCGTVGPECTVTQTGCALSIACGSSGTNAVTIDATDKGTYMGTFTVQGMMVNESCTVSFTSSTMLVDCQFTASGGAADCKADGTKK